MIKMHSNCYREKNKEAHRIVRLLTRQKFKFYMHALSNSIQNGIDGNAIL